RPCASSLYQRLTWIPALAGGGMGRKNSRWGGGVWWWHLGGCRWSLRAIAHDLVWLERLAGRCATWGISTV
ncbi:MAG: hypothetical protein P8X90_10665, partial [Desulfobacterales bacterium]